MNLSFLNNIVDKIYIIVIPKRYKYVKNIIKKYNLNVEIINAVLKKNIPYNKKNKKLNNVLTDYKGAVACYLSHIKTLKLFIKNNYNNCLILEDDFILSNYFDNINKLKQLNNNLNLIINNNNWDLIYLGGCWNFCNFSKKINNNFYKTNFVLCTHAYIINKQSANKFINNFNKFYIKKPIDREYNTFFNNKIIAQPNLFVQNDSESNIFLSNFTSFNFLNSSPECSYKLLYDKHIILLIIIIILIIFIILYLNPN